MRAAIEDARVPVRELTATQHFLLWERGRGGRREGREEGGEREGGEGGGRGERGREGTVHCIYIHVNYE